MAALGATALVAHLLPQLAEHTAGTARFALDGIGWLTALYLGFFALLLTRRIALILQVRRLHVLTPAPWRPAPFMK
jgi:hypothetical protein